jgi:carboxymethylenebutenolidase
MATRITFSSKGGEAVSGEIAFPEHAGKHPGIVLVQEWWGVNDHIRSLVDRFAKEGFVTLAPDLYHGKVTKDAGEAAKLMTELDGARALEDIRAAVHFLKEHEKVNGKVGVTGFCMGGAYTLTAATRIPEVSAAVMFYGIPHEGRADYAHAHAPIMAHVANKDQWVTVAKAEAILAEVTKHGHSMVLHVYDADHAFMNDTRPEAHAPEAAKLAWKRTVDFFHQHLG